MIVLRHDLEKLESMNPVLRYPFKDKVRSCDFIVLINEKNRGLLVCFCEVKTSICEENKQNALGQIRCSRVFFNYLLDSYRLTNDKNFNVDSKRFSYFLIHCGQEAKNTSLAHFEGGQLEIRSIRSYMAEDTNRIAKIPDAYNFFIR